MVVADAFQEALLRVMEQKTHWAWPGFTQGLVPKSLLHIHLEQEYATYVRDFPVLVARAYVQCPHPEVRRDLAENIYEEETGGMVAGRPHPELFMEYPRGLGMDLRRFQNIPLMPAAQAYRDAIDNATLHHGWESAAAVSTIFIEGTSNERAELEGTARKNPPPLSEHPLVKHYGLSESHLALTKAHRSVEGDHRLAAWRSLLGYAHPQCYSLVIDHMKRVLSAWLAYRDEVAHACGLVQGANGRPVVAA